MDKQSIDLRRAESVQYMELARKLAAEGSIEDALKAAFYAGIREADAQEAEERLERETFVVANGAA